MVRVLEYNYLEGYLLPPEDPIIAQRIPCECPAPKGLEKQTEDLIRYVELKASQYRYEFQQERYEYYEYLCGILESLARDNLMRAHLKYNEESHVMELTLVGKIVLYDADEPTEFKSIIEGLFKKCDSFLVIPAIHNCIRMKFSLNIAERIQIADYSEELAAIKQRVKG